jgi:uncharacterized protein (TIGR02453 family)
MPPAAPRFPPEALSFLRALKRHNDREWFRERRDQYEAHVRAPMVAVIERLAEDFKTFAPELIASPRASLYRIYRDTRFSEDKSPLKTHVAAVFPCRGLQKHEGAGLYVEVTPKWMWAGGGMYAPQTSQLQLVREHLAANIGRFRALVESPAFQRALGTVEGERLQRVPRGFAPEHPAAEYLKLGQFLAGREYPAALATSPRFYAELLKVFRLVAPMVRFLNEALLARAAAL